MGRQVEPCCDQSPVASQPRTMPLAAHLSPNPSILPLPQAQHPSSPPIPPRNHPNTQHRGMLLDWLCGLCHTTLAAHSTPLPSPPPTTQDPCEAPTAQCTAPVRPCTPPSPRNAPFLKHTSRFTPPNWWALRLPSPPPSSSPAAASPCPSCALNTGTYSPAHSPQSGAHFLGRPRARETRKCQPSRCSPSSPGWVIMSLLVLSLSLSLDGSASWRISTERPSPLPRKTSAEALPSSPLCSSAPQPLPRRRRLISMSIHPPSPIPGAGAANAWDWCRTWICTVSQAKK